MRKITAAIAAALIVVVAAPAPAGAHPSAGDIYTPWLGNLGEQRALAFNAGSATVAADAAPPGIKGMALADTADKDGTTNSDLAFWGNLVYAGNYDGFRILETSGDTLRTVVDHKCRGPQNDVSVHEMGGKRFLFQSIDSGQTAEDCSSADAPLIGGTNRVGFEGVRVFDVTNPAQPQFLDMIQTACGSHTHTLVPTANGAVIYVSSYPLGSGITPPNADTTPYGPDYRACTIPHKKISIIEVSAPNGKFTFSLKEKALSSDTTFNRNFQACHDIQIFMPKKLAVASCAGDGQLWDISDPANPTMSDGERHTHIRSPSTSDEFEFIHSGVVSWDGKTFAIMDETGGGVTAECNGAATLHGFYYFYDVVTPGAAAPPLKGRFTIPRAQTPQICVSHNATVLPIRGRKLMSAAYYQGGNTVIDFTDPANIREVAYSDLEDTTVGKADSWSTYWYNGRIYVNGGLGRGAASDNRGVEIYRLTGSLAQATRGAKTWAYSNPQTQEAWQAP